MIYQKVAICGNRRQDSHLEGLAALFSYMSRCGLRVLVHAPFAAYLEEKGVDTSAAVPVENLPEGVSLVMSIGGDGTFLRTFRWVGAKQIPILGVNTGHLGFLAGCRIEDADKMLEKIFRGDIVVERRIALTVEGEDLPDEIWPFALNEISMVRDERASLINVNCYINDRLLASYRADGLIVSTPTGSTAYNLSAGGPILQPTLDALVLSPIAPHTLTLRPVVVNANSSVSLEVKSRSRNFRLNLDDRSYLLPVDTKLTIRKADFAALLVRDSETDFAAVLRDRLLWNA